MNTEQEQFSVMTGRTRVSAEEMRCLKLLADHPAEWAWFMTDEEYETAQRAIERRKLEKIAEQGGEAEQ